MKIESLVPIGVVLIVAFFVFSIGLIIMEDMQEDFCDYTWIDTDTANISVCSSSNAVTGGYWGCCQTTNASPNSCAAWYTGSYSQNASMDGSESLDELASWGPTLALVLIAAIIIGVLLTYLARGTKV